MATITGSNRKTVSAEDLEPQLSACCALEPRHLAVCLFFGAVFLLVNTLPLLDWTVWSDIGVGRWILVHGTLPPSDPAQPLSKGVPVVHTSWGSQVILALADRHGGPHAVSNLCTVLTMAYLIVLARVAYRQTVGNIPASRMSRPEEPDELSAAPRKMAVSPWNLRPTSRVGLMLGAVAIYLIVGASGLFASAGVFGRLCFALLLGLLLTVQECCNRHSRPAKQRMTIPFLRQSATSLGFVQQAGGTTQVSWPRRAWIKLFGRQREAKTRIVPRTVWLATAGLFALWANLHGSYMLGLVVITCYALARAGEVAWRAKGLRPVLADAPLRIYLLLAAVAFGASLLNPYGPRLALANLAFLYSEQRMAMPNWHPLNPASLQGITFLASLSLLLLVMCASGRRLHAIDLLLPAVFGASVLVTQRAQGWYALVCVFVAMPHAVSIAVRGHKWVAGIAGKRSRLSRQARRTEISARRSIAEMGMPLPQKTGGDDGANPRQSRPLTARSFIFTLLCGLTLYCAFCLAPGTQTLMGGSARPVVELLGSEDLQRAAEWLQGNAPGALVYASPDWSDFLVGYGGEGVTAVMTSNAHWVPHDVRSSHRRIGHGDRDWEERLDRYDVDTLVLTPTRHAVLIQAVRRSPLWTVAHETESVLIARRE
ncbi:MAG: hypothetical protein RBS80_17100 [Thermoguttaceae bacterium]|nr:hypothetical protein [Thermoguttaceae bacterium]